MKIHLKETELLMNCRLFFKKENIIITKIDNCLNCYLGTMLLTNELLRLGDLEKIN